MNKNFQLVIVGVGGQGILTVSDILGTAAIEDGIKVVMSEVHGMSQRGGVVVAEMKMGGYSSPLIADGAASAILSFEPAEAYRTLSKAHKGTYVITNIEPLVPPGALMGKESYPQPDDLIVKMKNAGLNAAGIPATDIASQAGTSRAGNIVMLGALSAVKEFPVKIETIEKVISEKFPKF